MIDQVKVGSFLRELRKEKEKTQEEIAEIFGVSGRSVSRWENGNTMPDLGILVELADYYGVDLREIINGERKSETMNKETKELLKSAADYAAQEKKLAIRRKCIVTGIGTALFVVCIFLGMTLLPTLSATAKQNFDKIFTAIALIGLTMLWTIVIVERRRNKKDK